MIIYRVAKVRDYGTYDRIRNSLARKNSDKYIVDKILTIFNEKNKTQQTSNH